jgi:hypothetical protein
VIGSGLAAKVTRGARTAEPEWHPVGDWPPFIHLDDLMRCHPKDGDLLLIGRE